MKDSIRSFVEVISKELGTDIQEPIVEIGSFQVSGQEVIANLRPFFTNKQYIGCDIRPGLGVDRIENAEHMTFENDSIGTVLILETLEHVQNCFKTMDEIYRILKTNGIVVMSSVMNAPIHDYPSDYWRFTPDAFKLLLDKFLFKTVGYQGEESFPHTILGIGIKCDMNKYERYKISTDNIKNKYLITKWV